MATEGPKLGSLVIDGDTRRDAVHVAVVPVTATVRMRPGLRVGLDEKGDAEIASTSDCVGIVDPYLTADVEPGQRFWLFLFPGTVTSLRHAWTHPAFPDAETPTPADWDAAVRWLRDFAERTGAAYEDVVNAGVDFVNGTETYVSIYGGDDASRELRNSKSEQEQFLRSIEAVAGVVTPQARRERVTFHCHC